MLRVVAHKSAAAAKAYYTEGLKREDYYSEKQEVIGQWHGLAAELLGLEGKVESRDFAALAENRNPLTGEKLTPRTKLDRRVGYDINFHAPKSLSVLYALTGDKQILEAFRAAVIETMSSIETATTTRVRQKGAQSERVTGNLVWAEFVHFTARPVGGIPDPHLHAHCFAFNSTFDPVEERWKAASWAAIKKDAPYNEAVFHSLLTDKLAGLGYGIERTRGGWEVSGIPRAVIDKFSRRTAQIERLADAAGIADAKAKDALGAASREGKRRGLTHADLLAAWNVRLHADEKLLIAEVAEKRVGSRVKNEITPAQALDEACDKLLGKQSVAETKRIVAEALRFGVGKVTPEGVWKALEQRGMITRQVGAETFCTSLDALAEEVSLVNFVRSGRDRHAPLVPGQTKFSDNKLSAEQRAAVTHLLTSPDQVMAIRGGAGVGKTTAMIEAVAQIERAGHRVIAFAPSASASRGTLRESGFVGAETVARLLVDPKLQEKIRGQVILIDEAGLLGVRDMWSILQLAENSTRVILVGDIAQHAPVPRGDPFRLLLQYAGLPIAEITEIRRQEGDIYRKAVAALSRSDLQTGFRRLDELSAFIEVADDAERYRLLAQDYLKLSRKDSVPLVVSPTHAEGAKVTAAIREAKREVGLISAERPFIQLHSLQWEDADKRRSENYAPGMVVQFHQNAPGIRRGDVFRIVGGDDYKNEVRAVNDAGREITLPLAEAKRFQVYEQREISLARGDRLRITHGGKSEDGRRLNNGNVFTIAKFSKAGNIVLDNGAELHPKHGHIAYGYVSTSHSAQSKSVRDVLVAQSEASFAASSREQFYVSVSRGKQSIRIYTDSRKGLQEAVGNTSARQSGIELAGLTPEQIISFMATELGARQWRDAIHSRRMEGAAKSHVQNLLSERKQEGIKKPESMDFRQYLEMRRGMAGADGKSRSKGHPSGEAEKKAASKERGKSFLRPTQLSTPPKEKAPAATENKAQTVAQAAPKAPPSQNRQDRVASNLTAARNHFARVSEKVKGTFLSGGNQKRPHNLPQPSVADAARHGVKQRAADAASTAKVKSQSQVKTAAPVVRRGK